MQYDITRFQRENVTLIIEPNTDFINYTLRLTVKDTDDESIDNSKAIILISEVLTTTPTNGIFILNKIINLSFNLEDIYNQEFTRVTGKIDFGEYNYQVEVIDSNSVSKVLLFGLLKIKENIHLI